MRGLLGVSLFLLSIISFETVWAQQDFSQVEIQSQDLGGGVFMLTGQGGNLALSLGRDGAFLVDDQFAPLTEKILNKVEALGGSGVRFVANTHWHGDHTGGNENLGKSGSLILAHENVRVRMSSEQFMKAFGRKVPPSPPEALPVLTFSEDMTVFWNDEEIQIHHVAHAHTDGDSLVLFTRANVLHMGDTYFSGMYPFFDLSSQGSLDGMIAAVEEGLALANSDTRIIPGHGPLSSRQDLQAYGDLLKDLRRSISEMLDSGMSLDEIVAAKPTAPYDEEWGGGFMKPDVWTRMAAESLSE